MTQAKLCRFCGTVEGASIGTKGKRNKLPEQAPSGVYGASIKQQVFEVIVRQAMAGAPWKEICKGPMIANGIDPKEIEEELSHRQGNFAPHNDQKSKKSDVEFPYDGEEKSDQNIDVVIKTDKAEEKRKKKEKSKDKDKPKKKDKSKRKDKPQDEEKKE